ncbi:MAG TPA: FAD-binding oxidoreductase [Stellaceae bacterium]|nr:FAD-binding oxidoreductase [Stellaceae bacterium]
MSSDFLIIGGGIAGASAGYFLAERGRVLMLEREDSLGYHSTGRSAALYTETYGNAAIRALTVCSGPFFRDPPAGFTEHPLLAPRGVLMAAPPEGEAKFRAAVAEAQHHAPTVRAISQKEALRLCPVLRPEWFRFAFHEPDAMDMDVHAIHQGFLRGLRARGGTIVTGAEVQAISRQASDWNATTRAGDFAAPIVINAAGAWADEVARLAGVRPVGLVPKRRTAFIIDLPAGTDAAAWPVVGDVDETFYFKPEAGRLLVSPADETPVPPCDVQPEEMDVAEAAHRLEARTRIAVTRVVRKWAGLRSFVRDKTPVVGHAPEAPGFVWLAGQGGYGIQTSPSMGRVAAALATGCDLPADLVARGLTATDLLPDRLYAAPLS